MQIMISEPHAWRDYLEISNRAQTHGDIAVLGLQSDEVR